MSDIKAYICCKTCGDGAAQDIGLSDPMTLTVHCRRCDQKVAAFPLAVNIPLHCDVCDKDIDDPDHTHH